MGRHIVSRSLVICAMVLGLVALTVPAAAQTGQVRGKVTDAESKPVEGAKVTIQQLDNNTKFEVKSKKNGEFMQIGLPPASTRSRLKRTACRPPRRTASASTWLKST